MGKTMDGDGLQRRAATRWRREAVDSGEGSRMVRRLCGSNVYMFGERRLGVETEAALVVEWRRGVGTSDVEAQICVGLEDAASEVPTSDAAAVTLQISRVRSCCSDPQDRPAIDERVESHSFAVNPRLGDLVSPVIVNRPNFIRLHNEILSVVIVSLLAPQVRFRLAFKHSHDRKRGFLDGGETGYGDRAWDCSEDMHNSGYILCAIGGDLFCCDSFSSTHLLNQLDGFELVHIFREGNQCADKLANMGGNAQWATTILNLPPDEVKGILYRDTKSVAARRIY
nr:uncharacterized protein LOC109147779 [Ipomoea batatas]